MAPIYIFHQPQCMGPFSSDGLILIPIWMNNHKPSDDLDDITHPSYAYDFFIYFTVRI